MADVLFLIFIVITMKCSHCGKENNVRVIGLFQSGGEVTLKTLKKGEALEEGDALHTSGYAPEMARMIFERPLIEVIKADDNERNMLVLQVFREFSEDGPIVNSRTRAASMHTTLVDYARSKLYELAHPKFRKFLLDMLDSNLGRLDGLVWKPGMHISKKAIIVPKDPPTISSLDGHLWNDFADVDSVSLFTVELKRIKEERFIIFHLYGLENDPDKSFRLIPIDRRTKS